MSELLPCPFCGNYKGDENNDAPHVCYSKLRHAEFAHCERCGAEVHAHGKDPRVIWNSRPVEDGLRAELARRDEELKITDGLLKEATETIGAVIACCTITATMTQRLVPTALAKTLLRK